MPFILLAVLFISSVALSAEPVNYCQNESVVQEWEDLLGKYPNDPDIIKLYALRTGLCEMVDGGQLTLDQAIDIFETERLRVLSEKQREQQRLQPEQGA